jgi:D-alanyl-D-alanine-carboxypeptidase/D-alanyl-D-alanine-endopeptidase
MLRASAAGYVEFDMRRLIVIVVAACGGSAHVAPPPPAVGPEAGRYHEAIEAQIKPFLDAELVSGLVVGVYAAGKTEIYGFGKGPNNAPPDGATLFEIGPVTKVYTSLLLADAVQRREVLLETPIAELLPPGVTVPIRDKVAITLEHLALHSSGLPAWPPAVAARGNAPEVLARYGEDALYSDLIRIELQTAPGTQIVYSNFGAGLLGFALGRKIGGGYAKVLGDRVLGPLGLKDTMLTVPPALAARRAAGTNVDLAAAPAWRFDALAGAAGLWSTARDQLQLIDAELDAADGGARALRRAMKLTQEPALERPGQNEGLGWMIDSVGRYWHNGSTAGFHAFVGFDAKHRHGVVVLASTATSLVDRVAAAAYKILENPAEPPEPAKFPAAADIAPFAGTYDLAGSKLRVIAEGKRLYLEGPGEPRHRLSPLSDREFLVEALQSVAVFEKDGDKIARLVFGIGGRTLAAPRVDDK